MELDNIKKTLEDINELKSLIIGIDDNKKSCKTSSLFDDIIGKYVIVRTYSEGVNAGYVKQADETGIILTKCRRLKYHHPFDEQQAWYEGVANFGLGNNSQVSPIVEQKIIVEKYSITIVSEKAKKSIEEYPSHEQN